MAVVITPLDEETARTFEEMRAWLKTHIEPDKQDRFDDPETKLAILDGAVSNGWYNDNPWRLRALGLGLGDAIAQTTELVWANVEENGYSVPELVHPTRNVRVNAFHMIEKRVINGTSLDIFYLFNSVCDDARRLSVTAEERTPEKRSFFGSLFKPKQRH